MFATSAVLLLFLFTGATTAAQPLEIAFFNDWRSLEEISAAMTRIYEFGSQHTAHISLYSIGKSAEMRPIMAISVGKRALETSALMKKKKAKRAFKWKEAMTVPVDEEERTDVAVLGTLHGREWTAASSVLSACSEIVGLLEQNSSFIHEKTFHFIPIMNPDGYKYTFDRANQELNSGFVSMGASNGRLWRKNRRNLCPKRMRSNKCAHGVDLNRNFGIEGLSWGFGNTKVTTEVFQGKRPFSEPENRRIGEWMSVVGRHLKSALDVHCCSSAVLQPFFYRQQSRSSLFDHSKICSQISQSMGKDYKCRDRERSFSESNTGIFADWLANEVKIPLVFIVETKGNQESKAMEKIFLVPKDLIPEVNLEVTRAVQFVSDLDLFKKSEPEPEQVVVKEAQVDESAELERLFEELEQGALRSEFLPSEEISFTPDVPRQESDELSVRVLTDEPGKNNFLHVLLAFSGLIVGVIGFSIRSRGLKRKKRYLNKVI